MYAVWWNKPLNIACALRVYKKGKDEEQVATTAVPSRDLGRNDSYGYKRSLHLGKNCDGGSCRRDPQHADLVHKIVGTIKHLLRT